MAIYRLTTADETRTGGSNADTFDGYKTDDGFGETGGTDMLSGGGGDDLFLLDSQYSLVSGLIDGGADTDTVRAYGFDLGSLAFQNVEILSVESVEFGATIAQLNSFSGITTSLAGVSQIKFYLLGAGGTLDLSTGVAAGKGVELNALGLGSGYNATGTDQADVFKNSSHDDTVHGGLGADVFWGTYQDGSSGGTDLLYGDGGNDTFHLRRQSGTIDGGAGTDTVVARQFPLGPGSPLGDLGDASFVGVERLSTGPNITFATVAQLNSFATIFGGTADKLMQLDARSGAGGVIDFSTKLKGAADHVSFRAYGATSAVNATGTARADTLTGSAHNDTLTGGDGNDYLAGAYFAGGPNGRDTLIGGAGDDTYYVDSTDKLFDLVGPAGGIDTIVSTGSYDLANTTRLDGEFENLVLNGYLGAENPNSYGYGNALDNVITGNDGNNLLDGRAGADRLIVGGGNDSFVVAGDGDVVEDNVLQDEGIDAVLSSVDFDLGDANRAIGFIERVTLQGTASLNAYGNEWDNRLTGNAGDNLLDGRAGKDVMIGLAGNDIYYVDASWDRVIEADGEGIDTVYATSSFSLSNQFAESLLLVGPDNATGTGNQLNNLIAGNDAYNVLRGAGGDDTLTGGDGDNTLDGGAGRDYMVGGADRDTFVFRALTESGNTAATADRSSGFATGDKIHLRLIDASATLADDQAFVLDTDGSFSEGEIRQSLVGPDLLIELNADADAAPEMAIIVTSQIAPLASADFVL